MMEWFKNLSEGWQTAIFAAAVAVFIATIGGIIKILRKKDNTCNLQKKIHQEGSSQTDAAIDGDKNIIAGGNVSTGIDSEAALNTLVKTSKDLGRTEEEIVRLKEKVKKLEEQLANPSLETNIASEQLIPVPSEEAKELAKLINDDDGPYAQALKAIAEGDNEKADSLLVQIQQFLDTVQKGKDEAQVKIYIARMQNAYYSGRHQDALQYCNKLRTLAGNNSQIINNIAVVYCENAKYEEAESLFQRALKIDEASFGKDHPNVARDLNNLATLYQATGRLKEAEPLMERALKIDEASLGKDHPKVAIRLNNLAQLYRDTGRLKEAEPLMERHLVIFLNFTRQTGHPHPNLEAAINNYCILLTQIGYSRDEINERLKHLAPEMF